MQKVQPVFTEANKIKMRRFANVLIKVLRILGDCLITVWRLVSGCVITIVGLFLGGFLLFFTCVGDVLSGDVFKPIDRIAEAMISLVARITGGILDLIFFHPIRLLKLVAVVAVISLIVYFVGGNVKKNAPPQTVQTQAQTQMYAYVNADALNVRSSPSAQAEVVTRLNRNDRVQLLEPPDASKTWVRIRSGSNEGYVNANFLKQQ
jgi:hypothetical protein